MGGATISFLTLLDGILAHGLDAVIIIPDGNPEFIKLLESRNVKYYIVPVTFCRYPKAKSIKDLTMFLYRLSRNLYSCSRNVQTIKRICIKEKISLIHTNVGPIYDGHYAAKQLGIPHVWHIREYGDLDFDIHQFPSKSYFRTLLKQDHVITITSDLLIYNQLEKSPNARVIYNGVRKSNDIYLDVEKGHYFLCASRVSEEKGHDQVIRAFAKFVRLYPDWRLVILGRGKDTYLNILKDIVESERISGSVSFLGHTDNVTDYMRHANALVVASKSEGFGRMTAEAAFAGCLVIGRNSAGTKEILENTGGFLFDTEEQMLEQMLEVAELTNVDYCERAKRTQKTAVESYSEESYIDSVLNVYSKCAK